MSARCLTLAAALLFPVGVSAGGPKSPAPQKLHSVRGTLTDKDPRDRVFQKSPCKVYKVKFEAGIVYRIDLDSDDFDAFLRIEDEKGTPLAQADDGNGGTNARLVFSLKQPQTYRVVVTAHPRAPTTGAYTLTAWRVQTHAYLEREVVALTAAAARQAQGGASAAAERTFREALRLAREVYPKKHYPAGHLNLARTLHHFALALVKAGRAGEALPLLEEALPMFRHGLAPEGETAGCLLDLAGALQDLGRLSEARGHLEHALAFQRWALPPDDFGLAAPLTQLGLLLLELGKLAEARGHLERVLALCEKALPADHPDLAVALNNLASVHRARGDLEGAEQRLRQALAVWQKSSRPAPVDLAETLSNLGEVLAARGQREEGRASLERALAAFEKATPPARAQLACCLNNLAGVLLDLGHGGAALQHLERSVAEARGAYPADHPYLALAQMNLGVARWGEGRREDGWRALSDGVGAWSRHARRIAAGTARRDHADFLRTQRGLDRLVSAAVGAGEIPAAWREELLLRLLDGKGIGTAALASRRDALARGADAGARALAEQLAPLEKALARMMLRGPGQAGPEAHRKACADLQRQAEALERELGLRLQGYAQLRQALAAGPAEVAARLPPGAVLIETVRFDRHPLQADPERREGRAAEYAAAVLWPGGGGAGPQVRLVPLGAAAAIDNAITAWRAAVQKGGTDAAAEKTLRDRLWAPLAKALPEKAARLVVAPDGPLALLPLEALRLADGSFLIEKYTIHYVSSGRDLMPRPAPPARGDVAMIVADPDYGPAAGPAGLRFGRLPGFAREADAVEGLLKGRGGWRVTSARGAEASEEKLAEVRRPRLLHLVTHGYFLRGEAAGATGLRDLELIGAGPRTPDFAADPRLRSGLALAGANQWQERSARGVSDGLLTALEVENLDLWGTELVILSACETGLGAIENGEGVLGLRRAFQLAGAQTVLASLWKVPDAETEQLMSDTLSRWLKGTSPQEALREAQLAMIRRLRQSDDPARRAAPPLYWAAFICHGRPQ